MATSLQGIHRLWCRSPDLAQAENEDDDCGDADDFSQLASSLESSLTSSSTCLGCTEKVFDEFGTVDPLEDLWRSLNHQDDRCLPFSADSPQGPTGQHRDCGGRCRDTRDKASPSALYATGPLDFAACQELLWAELNQQNELYGSHRTASIAVQAERLQTPLSTSTLHKVTTCGGLSCSGAGPGGLAGWPASGARDRGLLVGWMAQLARAARLQPETLFAATSLLDRFVMRAEAYPHERVLQLLAMACMSVAMKFEEVNPLPNANLLALAVDPESGEQMYQVTDLARMEWLLLRSIDWRVRAPNALTFAQRFLHACGAVRAGPHDNAGPEAAADDATAGCASCRARSSSLARLALQLAEVSLLHDTLLPYDPSTVAMACLLLAERSAEGGGAAPSAFPPAAGVSWAAGRVCDFARMPLEALAPSLASCVAQLEVVWAGVPAPQAAPAYRLQQQQQPQHHQQVERRAHNVRQQQYGSYHYHPY